MAKPKKIFRCSSCGFTHLQFMGRCNQCGLWNTLEEDFIEEEKNISLRKTCQARPINLKDISTQESCTA